MNAYIEKHYPLYIKAMTHVLEHIPLSPAWQARAVEIVLNGGPLPDIPNSNEAFLERERLAKLGVKWMLIVDALALFNMSDFYAKYYLPQWPNEYLKRAACHWPNEYLKRAACHIKPTEP